MDTTRKEVLVRLATVAADELIDNIKHHGWRKFSTNFLREVIRCKYGEEFTNTHSPIVYAEVLKRRPDLGAWIKLKT